MLQALPSYYSNYSDKSLFISSSFNKYDNLLVTNEYCVASHNDSPCTLKNCNYHILLVTHKDVDDILGKLDSYCYLYQRVDCFYTLYKHYFYGNIIAKNGNISILYREQCLLIRETREWIECQAFQKRGYYAKSLKSTCLAQCKRQCQHRRMDQYLCNELNV